MSGFQAGLELLQRRFARRCLKHREAEVFQRHGHGQAHKLVVLNQQQRDVATVGHDAGACPRT